MAGQLTYPVNHEALPEGSLVDTRDKVVESHPASEDVDFGRGVVHADADPSQARTPKRNNTAVVFSADLVTSNTINGKVNGVALSQTTFATDHLTTMGVIAGKIETELLAQGIVAVATVGGASNRTITVVAEDANVLFADWVVAAGGSQATVSHTYASLTAFLGISMFQHQDLRAAGTPGYAATQTMGVVRRGRVRVKVNAAVAVGEDAYVNVATAAEEGWFTNVSSGNLATGGKFRTAAADNGIAEVEINLP
jgi:hypothetical protein